ncbi:MAG: 4-hydroxybenzoate octaprenyltransferase [Devosia sp.]|uniref:4-hydroxybenzoate octaprenyltransferase n=1 Tax=Devosia sp. TaxID=1871048 RepID=UPI002601CE73|nr:4-hydroxybenzoate octaprenyltransferase [Devosia sp.]MDB5203970.1 4-hydroxybenzoate octaprenyltransferase [Ferruginibacter sp.]MDB5585805.1 4-hydroxybenzoate octaprenyltransferase [Devosia sp.]
MSDTNIPPAGKVADAHNTNWVDRYAPEWLKPYARLARWDRPIPLLLLFWPCVFGLSLAAIADPVRGFDWRAAILMLIGSVLMRGAGCTFNDVVDRDIDEQVARTRSRPIPSGQVTAREAFGFLAAQAILGFFILLQFNRFTVILGVASLLLIAIYPFMKRVTWWPQAFLGLAFSYGALVGWSSQTGGLSLAPLFLYFGCIAWTIGYDTIYALQDIEDDALIGVKSTARLFGSQTRLLIGVFYGIAYVLWLVAAVLAGAGLVFAGLSLVAAGLLAWQVQTFNKDIPGNVLAKFLSNNLVGIALSLALLAEWVW